MENSAAHCGMVHAAEELSGAQNDARLMPGTRLVAASPKCHRFIQVCGIDTTEVLNPLDRETPIRISHVICHGTRYHHGARRHGHDSFRDLCQHCDDLWLKHYDASGSFDQGPGHQSLVPDFQQLCQSRGILPVVTWKRRGEMLWTRDMELCPRWHSRKHAVWKPRLRRMR